MATVLLTQKKLERSTLVECLREIGPPSFSFQSDLPCDIVVRVGYALAGRCLAIQVLRCSDLADLPNEVCRVRVALHKYSRKLVLFVKPPEPSASAVKSSVAQGPDVTLEVQKSVFRELGVSCLVCATEREAAKIILAVMAECKAGALEREQPCLSSKRLNESVLRTCCMIPSMGPTRAPKVLAIFNNISSISLASGGGLSTAMGSAKAGATVADFFNRPFR
mmetsp:Transcript_44649/g.72694  ORF Transcript_44649/g.72694 Transcript_44649/m.72694 type:complete len:222 (+) Transcript_44649:58-723(+)|eukprot:CAMPEP_0184669434 /NCGR_PEP_ID=MMETSP0308-20130426/77281_1 /TAXON_ID=38269 /ORGANISM="Gloeochaete witrockiana, Strain SAG 46.84" /LENGTH=221 /DNA_ID=CAMNT_0027115685 /DNA_START=35 /DNA_END=700 /DNA_ORIENTATION=-